MSTLVGSLPPDQELSKHWALRFSYVCWAPDPSAPRPVHICPGSDSCPSPPIPPSPASQSHTTLGGRSHRPRGLPSALTVAARGVSGQERALSQQFARRPFAISVSALLKKMGMDGLTEQKMPEGIPGPRIPTLAFCGGTEQTGGAGRRSLPCVRLPGSPGYL